MTSSNFPKIGRLLGWIKDDVKVNFGNNPMTKLNYVIAMTPHFLG